jgi:hypothetical protein
MDPGPDINDDNVLLKRLAIDPHDAIRVCCCITEYYKGVRFLIRSGPGGELELYFVGPLKPAVIVELRNFIKGQIAQIAYNKLGRM